MCKLPTWSADILVSLLIWQMKCAVSLRNYQIGVTCDDCRITLSMLVDLLSYLVLAIGASAIAQRCAKYLDFRLGARAVANIKERARLEKRWYAMASRSPARAASIAAQLVEEFFARVFGKTLLSAASIMKFAMFSVSLNFFLAILAVVRSSSLDQLSSNLSNLAVLKITATLVIMNIPLDLLAYLFSRALIRKAVQQRLGITLIILFSAISCSYAVAVLSTVLGAVLSMMEMSDWKLDWQLIGVLLIYWLKLGVYHPFTSQASMNGVNVGFLAIGALPSIFILFSTLLFVVFMQTVGRLAHYEMCMNIGRVLDDKKSFFELMALMFSMLLYIAWIVFSLATWIISATMY